MTDLGTVAVRWDDVVVGGDVGIASLCSCCFSHEQREREDPKERREKRHSVEENAKRKGRRMQSAEARRQVTWKRYSLTTTMMM